MLRPVSQKEEPSSSLINFVHPSDNMPFSFQGLKFWVSIHTPNRTKTDIIVCYWDKLVARSSVFDLTRAPQNHGGILVANEADADVRIMDPARAGSNPPPNMISPTWISECIKRQRQVDEEPFKVSEITAQPVERRRQEPPPVREGRRQEAPTMPRPPAGSHTRVRNEYTAEDDHILVQWMRMQAAKCAAQDIPLSTSGTKIYKELEQRVRACSPFLRHFEDSTNELISFLCFLVPTSHISLLACPLADKTVRYYGPLGPTRRAQPAGRPSTAGRTTPAADTTTG